MRHFFHCSHKRIFPGVFAIVFLLLTLGCKNAASGDASAGTVDDIDTAAPAINGAITFSGISAFGLSVQWNAASDNATAASALEYRVVKDDTAAAAIDSIAEIDGKS